MKILCLLPQRVNGVYFHRQIYPHSTLVDIYKDVKLTFTDSIMPLTDEQLQGLDIVHVSYSYIEQEDIKRIKRNGVKIIIDVDDYWVLGNLHELQGIYKDLNRTAIIKELIYNADAITTTTEILRNKILPINNNVAVFENGLHAQDDYHKPTNNEELTLGWVGGNTHTIDLTKIQHMQNGFGYKVYIPDIYKKVFSKRFSYYPNQGIPNYLYLYNNYDIILAPLVKNEFNRYKSPLKLVEAGFFKKAVMVSGVEPFISHLKHKENCWVVNKHSGWTKGLKALKDPEYREYLGNNLYSYVKERFSIEEISKRRYEFYKKLIDV